MKFNVEIKTVKVVVCDNCGAFHTSESDTYVSVYGNICVGEVVE